jgi:hypothetical protein
MANPRSSPPLSPKPYSVVMLLIVLGSIGGCVALFQWLPSEPGCHVLDWQTRTWVTEEDCLPSD